MNLLYVLIVLSVGLFLGWLEMYVIVIVELLGLVGGVRMWIAIVEMRCRVVNVVINHVLTSLMCEMECHCC